MWRSSNGWMGGVGGAEGAGGGRGRIIENSQKYHLCDLENDLTFQNKTSEVGVKSRI